MKRRTFAKLLTAGTLTAVSGSAVSCTKSAKKKSVKAALMHVGCQRGRTEIKELEFKARHGIRHIDGYAPKLIEGVGWDLDDALRQKELAARYDISIEAYHLPLSAAGIDNVTVPNIMLGTSPERDREIEMIQQMISVAGQAGVRALLYNTTILPVVRTERTPGRGGVTYSSWDASQRHEREQNPYTRWPSRHGHYLRTN